jgi:hypothetical protein
MARKTFISYKFSEARGLRDRIIAALGDDAKYYNGETADSPDLTDTSTNSIKNNLKDMIYGTSVLIVIISPNIKQSKWIDWEIEYSLKEIKRQDVKSNSNGIVGVIMKLNGTYDWLVSTSKKGDGCSVRSIASEKLYQIINDNRYNLTGDDSYSCDNCKTYSQLDGSYIALIEEESFLSDPQKYIENAFSKSQSITNFKITKQK